MKNDKDTRIQDSFLRELLKSKAPVTLFLHNGFRMDGTITGFDDYVIMFATDSGARMIYKRVISTIAPYEPVQLGG